MNLCVQQKDIYKTWNLQTSVELKVGSTVRKISKFITDIESYQVELEGREGNG